MMIKIDKGYPMLSENEIKDKLEPLFFDKELKLVLLFGSLASGKVHKHSDIDLGFLYENPINIIDLSNKVIQLLHTDRVDVVDLKTASPLLKYSAAKNGNVLYEKKDGMFQEFLSLAFRMYVDTKKLREVRKNLIRDYIQENT